mmetsp:Transcript_6619/g.16432  ORF Transcript_6619/g.16432 Transcript_6619/m.16432 type:complete len:212 (+) Transcript_6619:9018-9653(+)
MRERTSALWGLHRTSTGESSNEPVTDLPLVDVDQRADASSGARRGRRAAAAAALDEHENEGNTKLCSDVRSSDSRATSALAVTLPPAAAYSKASPIVARSTPLSLPRFPPPLPPPFPPTPCCCVRSPPSTTMISSPGAARSICVLCVRGGGGCSVASAPLSPRFPRIFTAGGRERRGPHAAPPPPQSESATTTRQLSSSEAMIRAPAPSKT